MRVALIPAYEPDSGLISIVRELKEKGFDIVVVNDGSVRKDIVFKETEKYANVLVHTKNMGKGAAIKTGLEFISKKFVPPYTVVTVDADGQHTVKDVIKVVSRSERETGCLILGSRRFKGDIPFRSRFGNTVTRFIYRLSSGVKVYDTQTGLRAFSDRLVPLLTVISGNHYEYEMNMLMVLAKKKIPIYEEWIETVYIEGNNSSHFHPLKDSARIYREILKFSASSIISFFVDYLLYCFLVALSNEIIFSNIFARVCSASVNYTLNRKLVFNSNEKITKSVFQYMVLAGLILVCNTLMLKTLVSVGLNRYIAKILAETCMFILSWFVQHKIIFKRKN